MIASRLREAESERCYELQFSGNRLKVSISSHKEGQNTFSNKLNGKNGGSTEWSSVTGLILQKVVILDHKHLMSECHNQGKLPRDATHDFS